MKIRESLGTQPSRPTLQMHLQDRMDMSKELPWKKAQEARRNSGVWIPDAAHSYRTRRAFLLSSVKASFLSCAVLEFERRGATCAAGLSVAGRRSAGLEPHPERLSEGCCGQPIHRLPEPGGWFQRERDDDDVAAQKKEGGVNRLPSNC